MDFKSIGPGSWVCLVALIVTTWLAPSYLPGALALCRETGYDCISGPTARD